MISASVCSRTLTLVCIMLAHTVMAFHMIYLLNPHFLEKVG